VAASHARDELRRLLRTHAVLRGDFVLSSGRHSDVYLDGRLVTLSARGAALVGQSFLEALSSSNVDAVAGLTLGADPIVSAIAAMSGFQGGGVDGLIIRKQAKQHGAGRRIEGPFRTDARVAIVDDTLTTGASALEAAGVVRAAGAYIVGVWAMIDREEGAREAVSDAGYVFNRLFTSAELLDDKQP